MNKVPPVADGSRDKPSVCVVTPYLPSISETFIRAHIERLPTTTTLIHGWRPTVGDRAVLSLPSLVWHKTLRILTGVGLKKEITAAYITAFQRHKAAVVLAEYGTTGVLVEEACRRLGIPLVVYFHGFDASMKSVLAEHKDSYRLLFKEAAAIVAVSRAMEKKLVSLGAQPEKIHFIPYGVDCEQFVGANPRNAPPLFLAIGRFVEKKAPNLTLAAFAKVLAEFSEARLRMVGEGPLLEGCRQLARELNVQHAVTFLGSQPHESVRDEMQRARCFVQHSVEAPSGDSEGTPVGILEAGASGLPVISTRHAGIPEVVVDEETGLLVAERDVDAMAERMLRLARDPELAETLGNAGSRRIRAHFTMDRSIRQLWDLIDHCISGTP